MEWGKGESQTVWLAQGIEEHRRKYAENVLQQHKIQIGVLKERENYYFFLCNLKAEFLKRCQVKRPGRKRRSSHIGLAVLWTQPLAVNGFHMSFARWSSTPSAQGSKAKAARLHSATTQIGFGPTVPWEPAEVEKHANSHLVSDMDYNCKGMERDSLT